MSKMTITYNLDTQECVLTLDDIAPSYADLRFCFNKLSASPFKNLKFKFELKQAGNIKQYGVYPPAGVSYVSTDQDFLLSEPLNLIPDKEYELYLWMEHDGVSAETTEVFTSPKPPQPFPSWTWENDMWNPPVERPDNAIAYSWDEDTLAWVSP
jgi:hypothetical protein